MANPAFSRPDMHAPQTVDTSELTSLMAQRKAPLSHTSGGEIPDRIFELLMTGCGLAVMVVLGLIVYELLSRSGISWHAFGLKFFAGSEWDPVNEHVGALPFIFGTLVSSLLALIIA